MGYEIQSDNTTRNLLFMLVSSADHITGLTGATPTVSLSKNGATFAAPSGAVSEIGNGWYKIAANAADASALGPLLVHATASGADPLDDRFNVVAYNPDDATRLGLSALPNVAAGAAGGIGDVVRYAGQTALVGTDNLPKVSLWSILGTALSETVGGYLAAAFKQFFNVAEPTSTMNEITLVATVTTNSDMRGTDNGALAATALSTTNWTNARAALLDHLDADVSSRMATFTLPTRFSSLSIDTSGQVTFNNTTIGTATNLTNAPTAGDFTAAMKASLSAATPSVTLTDLPAIPAGWLTAAGIATGALDGKGDWLPSSSYTAPDNAGIAAIKTKTDNLPASPAAAGDAMSLTTAERTALANALLDLADAVETGITTRQALRGIVAALFGKLSTANENPEVYQNPAGTANRLSVANDSSGNRTAVTTTL